MAHRPAPIEQRTKRARARGAVLMCSLLGIAIVGCYHDHGPGGPDADREHDASSSADAEAADAGPAPFIVRDTSGWSVAFPCRGWDGACNPPTEIPPGFPVDCEPERRPVVRSHQARVFHLYATCADAGGWAAAVNFARAVTCTVDAECARLPESASGEPADYTCTHGLCQNLAHDVTRSDVLVLCLDAAPRTASWAEFLEYDEPEIARAYRLANTTCPSGAATCTVPPECRAL